MISPGRRAGAAALAWAALALAGCGKPPEPKVEMKALERAKGMEADLNRKAQESVDKIESTAK
jgi:ABC-type uncharacterized transport system auxiliary subunit